MVYGKRAVHTAPERCERYQLSCLRRLRRAAHAGRGVGPSQRRRPTTAQPVRSTTATNDTRVSCHKRRRHWRCEPASAVRRGSSMQAAAHPAKAAAKQQMPDRQQKQWPASSRRTPSPQRLSHTVRNLHTTLLRGERAPYLPRGAVEPPEAAQARETAVACPHSDGSALPWRPCAHRRPTPTHRESYAASGW